MIEGPATDLHHLITKSKKGKETVLIHLVCHRKIHSILTEKEIATKYNTIEKLKTQPDIIKFIKWVKNRNSEFVDTFRESNNKKRGRR